MAGELNRAKCETTRHRFRADSRVDRGRSGCGARRRHRCRMPSIRDLNSPGRQLDALSHLWRSSLVLVVGSCAGIMDDRRALAEDLCHLGEECCGPALIGGLHCCRSSETFANDDARNDRGLALCA